MIPFEKWHGAGNDFILIDGRANDVTDPRTLAIRECSPADGIGADGLLVLVPDADADPVRVEMTLYQPDGSTAAMCGNGARCVAKWMATRHNVERVTVDTPAGPRDATVSGDEVTVEMGAYSFDPALVPLAGPEPLIDAPLGDLMVTAVNTGVPHAVSLVDDVDAIDLETVAPPIRHADIFTEGANVTIADQRNGAFRQRTFERGVEGETVACGTGAVAIGAVAYRREMIGADDPTIVYPPGGTLAVRIRANGTAALSGPVEHEFSGEVAIS